MCVCVCDSFIKRVKKAQAYPQISLIYNQNTARMYEEVRAKDRFLIVY